MAAAADLQTKNTVLANLNQAGIDPGICAELKLRSGKGRTQLNLQIRRTYNLDLTAVGIGKGGRGVEKVKNKQQRKGQKKALEFSFQVILLQRRLAKYTLKYTHNNDNMSVGKGC